MSSTFSKAVVYAVSLRPSGGLTVAKLVIEALVNAGFDEVVVYTGAEDGSRGLEPLFRQHECVVEKRFIRRAPPMIRYFLAKIYFLPASLLWKKNTVLFSFNFYVPVVVPQIVYHINLSLFLKSQADSFADKIRKYDAYIACRRATVNLFESEFLLKKAQGIIKNKIKESGLLYAGADPQFFQTDPVEVELNHILVVSSTQPHKDNQTCLRCLKLLLEKQPSTNWRMSFVGGQSIAQWDGLKASAKDMGIQERVIFPGPMSKPELAKLMSSSLCLISASRVESFCMVAVEAMAAHCPVIVTAETSMPESVGDAGIVVEAGNAEQFSSAIVELNNDPSIRRERINRGIQWSERFKPVHFQTGIKALCETYGFIKTVDVE